MNYSETMLTLIFVLLALFFVMISCLNAKIDIIYETLTEEDEEVEPSGEEAACL